MDSEEMLKAARIMEEAAQNMSRACNALVDAVEKLLPLIGSGYGNNIEKLIELLEKKNENVP